MKKESLYVIGAGNHAKIVLSTLEASGMECAGIYDDDASLHGKCLWNVPILGPISALADTPGTMAVIAISDNDIRKEIASRFENICWPVLVHPQTCVHSSVHLREGTVVFPGALILADTKIGAHTIINIVRVVRNLVCQIAQLRLQARPLIAQEARTDSVGLHGLQLQSMST